WGCGPFHAYGLRGIAWGVLVLVWLTGRLLRIRAGRFGVGGGGLGCGQRRPAPIEHAPPGLPGSWFSPCVSEAGRVKGFGDSSPVRTEKPGTRGYPNVLRAV